MTTRTSLGRSSLCSTGIAFALVALGVVATGCAARGGMAPRSAAPANEYPSAGSYDAKSAPANDSPATMAPPPAPAEATSDERRAESAGAVPEDRPGLATHWGEERISHVHTESFTRADWDHPNGIASLFYNDAEGSRAMASAEGFRRFDRAAIGLIANAITVSLRDENGRTLSGYSAGGKTFAIGEAGERYSIVLENHTPARFEAVVSVDGLDVMDGKPASFEKRGYLLNPHSSVEIDGFRTSESSVAAFRFGSVRGSYAARKGDDRNVGVIGVAVFGERGVPTWPWGPSEVDRRRNADPFPGSWASPPP